MTGSIHQASWHSLRELTLEKSSIADSMFDTSTQQRDRAAYPRLSTSPHPARPNLREDSYPNRTLAAFASIEIQAKCIVGDADLHQRMTGNTKLNGRSVAKLS